MTHKDIYTKFMIEYDKAGASTSYPSLTEYEVATVLDKAYNALIAQKVTGNNYRRSTVESDIKSIADLGPLTKSDYLALSSETNSEAFVAPNVSSCEVPEDMLYFLQGQMKYNNESYQHDNGQYTPFFNDDSNYNPVDGQKDRAVPVKLVNHEIAQKFFASASNIPWVKQPVCFLEDRRLYVVYDPLNVPCTHDNDTAHGSFRVTYIRRPHTFVKNLDNYSGTVSYFDDADQGLEDYQFECNSTVAEELISLAVAFALENVESQRLNSKLNMRGLEA